MLFGPVVHAENRELADLNAREVSLMLPLCALALWIGVRPGPFLGATDGSVDALVERLERARATLEVSERPAEPAGPQESSASEEGDAR